MKPCDTPRRSLGHEIWIGTFDDLAEKYEGSTAAECARFAANVLRKCGDSEELAQFLDERTLKAMETSE